MDVSLIHNTDVNNISSSVRLDNSPISIGYDFPIMFHNNYSLSVGATFLSRINSNINDVRGNYYFISLYASPVYKINNRFQCWIKFGINKPTNSKYNPGLMYGFGFDFLYTDKFSFGIGSLINSTSNSFNNDIYFKRMTVLVNYLINK